MSNKSIIINKNKISYMLKKKIKRGANVSIIFLCGYKSDKNGTKSIYLQYLRKKFGFEFITFDYSGHGQSEGDINNLLLSDWINESKVVIEKYANHPIILVGSSMGGWISFYLTSVLRKKIFGVIGISSAINFTSDIVKNLNKQEYKKYLLEKKVLIKSEYSDTPYCFSKKFIDDSAKFYLLKKNNPIKQRTTLLYGLKDSSVKIESQLALLNIITHQKSSLIISRNSDHRMSSVKDLELLEIHLNTMIKDIL